MKKILIAVIIVIIAIVFILAISGKDKTESHLNISRYDKIPSNATKVAPETDVNPVKSLSSEYKTPVPLKTISSKGAEDSPFVMPDGKTLFFFFTPDVKVPVEKQLLDGVTGIWVSNKINDEWQEPERVFLQKEGKLALDGCEFVSGKVMLFCSAREGYTGIRWFSALFNENIQKWEFDKEVKFPEEYEVGELHEYNDEIYYHSSRAGGKGGLDIWKIKRSSDGTWAQPENVEALNTERNEGWPALSPDGNEIWISRDYGIWKAKKINNEWTTPELIFSPLAGEASIDSNGNVYFTHHFYKNDEMIEADIYFAEKI